MTAAKRSCRVGADIGGTFTDIAIDVDGALHTTKVLTSHVAPERPIVEGLCDLIGRAGLTLADVDVLIHGTTLATNALIERKGARTAFVTTEGFRDVIEMRTENRFEQYDLNITLPSPLIERRDRFTIRERIAADGSVLLPLDVEGVHALATDLQRGEYQSIAIGLIHAYANPEHECRAREVLERYLPGVPVSIASEVSPQIREFERFNTVCANAYVQPPIKVYLASLVSTLRALGMGAPIYMLHSGGGVISVEDASRFPVRLVESGPAGGAIFAADFAARHGLDQIVSFDMGGTTAKICLIERFKPKQAKSFEVARTCRFLKGSGMPISIPVVEMVEIGAGGGSVARIDPMRQIRVGPDSAGSEPGPACYGRGGVMPTVTDADLMLGRLDPAAFAGGSIQLSRDRADDALQQEIGASLTLDTEAAAFGVCEVVDENMANAGRVHAIESGKTMSDFTMIAFGGAGPLHASRLCEKLGIGSFLVPRGAGVGSAIGFLRAPFGYEAVRSASFRLSAADPASIDALLSKMAAEAARFVVPEHASQGAVVERTAFMRYVGQGWDIPVPFPDGVIDMAALRSLFEEAYGRYFGRGVEGLDVEAVGWSVKMTVPLAAVVPVEPVAGTREVPRASSRRLFDAAQSRFVDAGVFERGQLESGDIVRGPAVVVETETSTILTGAFAATVQNDGSLLVARQGSGRDGKR